MRQILTALLAALASWPAIATELVEIANALPLDAHELSYGDGWECNRGFKKRNQSCVKITAAFQDILELDCCNCNASDLWSKIDAAERVQAQTERMDRNRSVGCGVCIRRAG